MENKEQNNETILSLKEQLGEKIKKYREEKKISIEEVCERTSLSVKQIKEIETGNANENNAKERIYIIKYLKYLGIYNDEMKDLLNQAYENNIDQLTHTTNLSSEMKNINFNSEIKKKKNKKSAVLNLKFIFTCLIIFLLIVGLVVLFAKNFSKNVTDVKENKTTLIQNTTLQPKETIDTKPKANIAVDGNKINITGANNYNVCIKLKGDAYLSINEYAPAKTYKKDEEINFDINESKKIILKTGKIENLEITINETPVLFENQVGVKTLTFDFKVE